MSTRRRRRRPLSLRPRPAWDDGWRNSIIGPRSEVMVGTLWLLFLTWWLVFGRLFVMFSMVTTTFQSGKGIYAYPSLWTIDGLAHDSWIVEADADCECRFRHDAQLSGRCRDLMSELDWAPTSVEYLIVKRAPSMPYRCMIEILDASKQRAPDIFVLFLDPNADDP